MLPSMNIVDGDNCQIHHHVAVKTKRTIIMASEAETSNQIHDDNSFWS